MNINSHERSESIDLLRAVAIIGMIICHTMSFLSYEEPGHPLLSFIGQQGFGDFPAAIFIFASGLSLALTFAKCSEPRLVKEWQRRNRRRGVLIFFLGLLFSVIIWGPRQIFIWGVLTLTGSSIVVLSSLIRLPAQVLAVLAAGVLLSAPWVRSQSDFLLYWGGDLHHVTSVLGRYSGVFLEPVREFISDFSVKSIFLGFLSNGEFPFLPWFAFSVIGFLVGRVHLKLKLWTFVLAGLLSIGFGFGLAFSAFFSGYHRSEVVGQLIAPFSFYPNSLSLFLVQLGVCLIFFSVFRSVFEGLTQRALIKGWLKEVVTVSALMSRYTLSIFFLHHMILLWPISLAGLNQGHPLYYYGRIMSPPLSLFMAILVTVFCYFSMRYVDRSAPHLSLESLVRKMSSHAK